MQPGVKPVDGYELDLKQLLPAVASFIEKKSGIIAPQWFKSYPPDSALRECHILRNALVQVVAHHKHVHVLVDGVDRVRPSAAATTDDNIESSSSSRRK